MSLFLQLAQLGERLEATSSRKSMASLVADYLTGLAPSEIAPAARMIIGRAFPETRGRPLKLSGAAVARVVEGVVETTAAQRQEIAREAVDIGQSVQMLFEQGMREPARQRPLSLEEVWQTFQEIAAAAGPGSRQRKDRLLQSLFQRSCALEAKYLAKLSVGEMRHGVSEGLLLDSIALAAGVPRRLVRRANMLTGDVGQVAGVALQQGGEALERIAVTLGQPIKPMLAQTASSVEEAMMMLRSELALEYKLDGARVQIHRSGQRVWLFSRHLADMTVSLPEVQEEILREVSPQRAILEGEVIAIATDGRPKPFQHLMRRLGRVHEVRALQQQMPVKLYLFDILYADGESWIDRPYRDRVKALQRACGSISLVERLLPSSVRDGEAFLSAARTAGHEGLMAKALGSRYSPGARGRYWLKIKPTITLDLVIVGAEWGYGRRHGWLSNYHLAARDEESGDLFEVGKTFKGLTDREFEEMTELLLKLRVGETQQLVTVRPEVVVEVAFNGVQDSPQYPSGVALRFARIVRLRPDKPAEEADTIQTLRTLQLTGH